MWKYSGSLHQVGFFEANRHHLAGVEDEHDDNRRQDAGNINMQNPLELVGAVHHGRFVKLGLMEASAARYRMLPQPAPCQISEPMYRGRNISASAIK